MFETLSVPEIVPDEEQEEVLRKVSAYFESVSQNHEEGRVPNKDKEQRIATVLEAIKQNDFIPAAEYLAEEIKRIQNQIPLYGQNEIGRAVTVPAMKQEIEDLQKLLESLSLEEK